jgi:uncharacterized protein (TIGR02284 family)
MSNSTHGLQQAGAAIYAVIQSLIDSQEALVEVGEKLSDQNLRHFFLAESLKRAEFRGELEIVLNQEGVGNLRESGAKPGSVQRALACLRSGLRDAGDHTLLATAEQGEGAAKVAYDNAISAVRPPPIRDLLTAQASHIQESRDVLKAALKRTA